MQSRTTGLRFAKVQGITEGALIFMKHGHRMTLKGGEKIKNPGMKKYKYPTSGTMEMINIPLNDISKMFTIFSQTLDLWAQIPKQSPQTVY